MSESKHDDSSSRHQSRAAIWSALIGSIGVIAAAWIGVSLGRGRGEDQRTDLRKELEQRDAQIAELRKEITGIHNAQEPTGRDEGNRQNQGTKPEGQSQQESLDTQTRGAAPPPQPTRAAVQRTNSTRESGSFETESYRLNVTGAEKRGTTLVITLLLESTSGDVFRFRLDQPYIVDDQGGRLELSSRDSAGFMGDGAEVLPHMKLRSSLSFCDMGERYIGGFFQHRGATCTGKPLEGNGFTLAAEEVMPQGGRKIILAGLSAECDTVA